MKHQRIAIFTAVFAISMGFAAPAYAYLDPGTAGMILQLAIGGVVGALVFVKLYWMRFKAFFLRNTKAVETIEVSNEPQDPEQRSGPPRAQDASEK